METTPETEMGIEPLVERVARAMAADQSKRLYGIDRGQDEAWEANTDYGRTELLADARAAIAAHEATRTPEAAQVESDKPYRTMDEAGEPHCAGVVGWNWICELAGQVRAQGAMPVIQDTHVQGDGKITRLYRETDLLAVATTFRDDMNFTVLVRWLSPEMRAALAQFRHPSGEQSS
jgi:hypothetical protein